MPDVFLPIVPNWQGGVRETYEFLTSIYASRDGTEQRRSERVDPRRSVEIAALLDGERLRDFIGAITRAQDGIVFAGDFTAESAAITQSVVAGGQVLQLTSIPAWLVPGVRIAVVSNRRCRFSTVDAVVGLSVLLSTEMPDAIGTGARVVPVIEAEVGQARSVTLHTTLIGTTSLTLNVTPGTETLGAAELPDEVSGPVDGAGVAAMFRGRYVLLRKPNFVRAPEMAFDSPHTKIDYGRGVSRNYAPVPMVSRTITVEYLGIGRADILGMRDIFLRAKGRAGEIFVPTWTEDFGSRGEIGVNYIVVHGTDFYHAYAADPAYRTILIRTVDGKVQPAQINSINISGPNSVVWLDADLVGIAGPGSIARISWMFVCRFAQDELSIDWSTATVADLAMSFTTLHNLPVEDAWSNWILATGYWRDSGEWIDSEVWRDS